MMELKYYKLRSKFDQDVLSGSVITDDLVFIEDTKELYTHGTFFGQDQYGILNYDNIVSQSGDPFTGNINSQNLFIQYTTSGAIHLIPATYIKVRTTHKQYVGHSIGVDNDHQILVEVYSITYNVSNRTYSASHDYATCSGLTETYTKVLDNISQEGRTYITGGETVRYSDSTITVPSETFIDGSNSIPEDNLILFSATQSKAGVMSADDKKSLDSLVSTLKTYNVIKTQSLLNDKFIVGLDGIPVAASTISSSIVSSKPGSGISPVGLYIVTNYISGHNASVVARGSDDKYYTQWNQFTDQAGNVIPAHDKQVGSDYVIKDNNQNISTKTLFTYRHYADQDITSMYHAKSDGTVVQASELINDYVYEKTLRS